MFHKIKDVKPLDEFILEITFQDESIKYYDVKSVIDRWPSFNDLLTIAGLFSQVKVDNGGYGISWNDEIDLSCNELWENGYSK